MVKNPPSNAGDAGSIPGQGTKIPRAAGQLSPHTMTAELARLNERAHVPQTTEPTHSGTHEPQLERENPPATTREKPARHNRESTLQRKDPTCLIEDPSTKTRSSQKYKENK